MRVLQVCPNDHPPFVDVCRGYAAAIASLGYEVSTVFLESRGYLDQGAEFPGAVGFSGRLADSAYAAIIAHRWGAFRASIHLDARVRVLVAHEFGLLRSWRRRLVRLRRSGLRFAAVSNAVARDIAAYGVGDVLTWPNPLDVDALDTERLDARTARARLGLPPEATIIGVVGRLHPKKDPFRAIEPFLDFAGRRPDAHLIYVGDGELRVELEAAVADHPAIVLLGHVADARRYLEAFDAVLACATEKEAFGMVLLEAMAAGVPVVCADRPGPKEVLGPLGFYFDDDDAMIDALERATTLTPVGRSNLRREANVRTRDNFSVSSLAERLQTVLC